MRWILVLMALIACVSNSIAQNSPEEPTDVDINTWALRAGFGIQKSPYVEIGLTRLMTFSDGLPFGSNAFYTSVEFNRRQNSDDPLYYGFKAGYESSWALWMFALEGKYVSDFKQEGTFLLTPKIGLSLLGCINLLYGYNFPKDLNSFPGIGNHQFSLTIHYSKKLRKAAFGK